MCGLPVRAWSKLESSFVEDDGGQGEVDGQLIDER